MFAVRVSENAMSTKCKWHSKFHPVAFKRTIRWNSKSSTINDCQCLDKNIIAAHKNFAHVFRANLIFFRPLNTQKKWYSKWFMSRIHSFPMSIKVLLFSTLSLSINQMYIFVFTHWNCSWLGLCIFFLNEYDRWRDMLLPISNVVFLWLWYRERIYYFTSKW